MHMLVKKKKLFSSLLKVHQHNLQQNPLLSALNYLLFTLFYNSY